VIRSLRFVAMLLDAARASVNWSYNPPVSDIGYTDVVSYSPENIPFSCNLL